VPANERHIPGIENAFHALALDEHRGNFPPTLWYLDPDNTSTRLTQCWFPGYHADVGGGTVSGPLVDDAEIAEVTFAWMVDQVSSMLTMDSDALNRYFLLPISPVIDPLPPGTSRTMTQGGAPEASPPATLPREPAKSKICWGIGKISDPMTLFYRIVGGEYVRRPGQTVMYYHKYGKGQVPRERYREEIHPLVHYRITQVPDYNPVPLAERKGWRYQDGTDGKGRRWIKKGWLGDGFEIREYRIPVDLPDGLEERLAPDVVLRESVQQ